MVLALAILLLSISECPTTICTLEFNPQCGNDGKTYGNPCQLRSAQCDNSQLELAYSGECLGKYDVFLKRPYWGQCDELTYSDDCFGICVKNVPQMSILGSVLKLDLAYIGECADIFLRVHFGTICDITYYL